MEKFKSIPELIQSLNQLALRINKGSVGLEEFEATLRDARELYERLVILRYKAIEDRNLMGGSPTPEIEAEAEVKKVPKPETNLKAKQISLIDSIEEIAREDSPTAPPEAPVTPEVKQSVEPNTPPAQPKPTENQPTEREAPRAEVIPPPPAEPTPTAKPANPAVGAEKSMVDIHDTLADKWSKTKIDDLTVAIGLNQKFRFINELFDGDSEAYNKAVKVLNQLPDKAAAQTHLHSELVKPYKWDEEDEVTLTFLNLVERRYQS